MPKIRDLADKLRIHKIEIYREELENGSIDLDITFFFDDNPKLPYSIREFRKSSKMRKALESIEAHIRRDYK